MKVILLIALLPFLLARSIVDITKQLHLDNIVVDSGLAPLGWASCGGPNDLFNLRSLVVVPENPKKGDKVSISLEGYLKKDIQANGKLTLLVKFGVLTIVKETRNFCDELANIPDIPHCPLKAGDLKIVKEEKLPDNVPAGRYTVRVSANDDSGAPIFCVTGTFQITQ